jgi:hypothetical protein
VSVALDDQFDEPAPAAAEQPVFRSGDYVVHQETQGLYQVDQPMGLGRYQIVALFHDVAPTRTVFASTLQRASEEQVRQWRASHRDARPEPAVDHLLDQAEQELPAWSLWIDEDGEACGGQHNSGYKLGPVESVIDLINEARRLTPLLAEFAEHKWMVSHNVSHDIWFAEHMEYGTVQASSLPDLAFNAYLARYVRQEPDLPRALWQATWLEGWQFEGHLPGDRYRLVRGGEAWEPTFNELCHVYSYDEQPAPQPEPAVTFPHPLAHEVPDDLPGWVFQVVDKHHVQGTHPDYGTCTATGGSTAAFDQARYTQRQAQQKTKPIPSAEHTAMLTRGEIRNLWKCLHGDQMWLSHARATVERLARQAGVELEEVAA